MAVKQASSIGIHLLYFLVIITLKPIINEKHPNQTSGKRMSSQGPYGRQGFQSNPTGYGGTNQNATYGSGGDYSTPQYGGAGYGGSGDTYGSGAAGYGGASATYGGGAGYGGGSSYSAPPLGGGYGADYAPYGAQVQTEYEVRLTFLASSLFFFQFLR